MANKTVSKPEHTVLSISISLFPPILLPLIILFLCLLFSLTASFSLSYPFSFHLPFILTFWPYFSSHLPPRRLSELRKTGAVWRNECGKEEVWVRKSGRLRYLALYVLAQWRVYWLIRLFVKCLSLYSAVANASASGNVPISCIYILGVSHPSWALSANKKKSFLNVKQWKQMRIFEYKTPPE